MKRKLVTKRQLLTLASRTRLKETVAKRTSIPLWHPSHDVAFTEEEFNFLLFAASTAAGRSGAVPCGDNPGPKGPLIMSAPRVAGRYLKEGDCVYHISNQSDYINVDIVARVSIPRGFCLRFVRRWTYYSDGILGPFKTEHSDIPDDNITYDVYGERIYNKLSIKYMNPEM